MAFGAAVRATRLEHADKLPQDRLAERAGVDRSFVGQVERGERNVNLANIARLAFGLEVTPSDLLRRAEGFVGWSDLAADSRIEGALARHEES